MPQEELPVTYTVTQVARILKRTPETIRKHIKDGTIPASRLGNRYIITKETLDKILRGEIRTE